MPRTDPPPHTHTSTAHSLPHSLPFIFLRCRCLSLSLCVTHTSRPYHPTLSYSTQTIGGLTKPHLRVKWLPLITAELMTDTSTEPLSNWIQQHWKACFFLSLGATQHATRHLSAIVTQILFTWILIKSHLQHGKKEWAPTLFFFFFN